MAKFLWPYGGHIYKVPLYVEQKHKQATITKQAESIWMVTLLFSSTQHLEPQ